MKYKILSALDIINIGEKIFLKEIDYKDKLRILLDKIVLMSKDLENDNNKIDISNEECVSDFDKIYHIKISKKYIEYISFKETLGNQLVYDILGEAFYFFTISDIDSFLLEFINCISDMHDAIKSERAYIYML